MTVLCRVSKLYTWFGNTALYYFQVANKQTHCNPNSLPKALDIFVSNASMETLIGSRSPQLSLHQWKIHGCWCGHPHKRWENTHRLHNRLRSILIWRSEVDVYSCNLPGLQGSQSLSLAKTPLEADGRKQVLIVLIQSPPSGTEPEAERTRNLTWLTFLHWVWIWYWCSWRLTSPCLNRNSGWICFECHSRNGSGLGDNPGNCPVYVPTCISFGMGHSTYPRLKSHPPCPTIPTTLPACPQFY